MRLAVRCLLVALLLLIVTIGVLTAMGKHIEIWEYKVNIPNSHSDTIYITERDTVYVHVAEITPPTLKKHKQPQSDNDNGSISNIENPKFYGPTQFGGSDNTMNVNVKIPEPKISAKKVLTNQGQPDGTYITQWMIGIEYEGAVNDILIGVKGSHIVSFGAISTSSYKVSGGGLVTDTLAYVVVDKPGEEIKLTVMTSKPYDLQWYYDKHGNSW